jgi:hypothetical protein
MQWPRVLPRNSWTRPDPDTQSNDSAYVIPLQAASKYVISMCHGHILTDVNHCGVKMALYPFHYRARSSTHKPSTSVSESPLPRKIGNNHSIADTRQVSSAMSSFDLCPAVADDFASAFEGEVIR